MKVKVKALERESKLVKVSLIKPRKVVKKAYCRVAEASCNDTAVFLQDTDGLTQFAAETDFPQTYGELYDEVEDMFDDAIEDAISDAAKFNELENDETFEVSEGSTEPADYIEDIADELSLDIPELDKDDIIAALEAEIEKEELREANTSFDDDPANAPDMSKPGFIGILEKMANDEISAPSYEEDPFDASEEEIISDTDNEYISNQTPVYESIFFTNEPVHDETADTADLFDEDDTESETYDDAPYITEENDDDFSKLSNISFAVPQPEEKNDDDFSSLDGINFSDFHRDVVSDNTASAFDEVTEPDETPVTDEVTEPDEIAEPVETSFPDIEDISEEMTFVDTDKNGETDTGVFCRFLDRGDDGEKVEVSRSNASGREYVCIDEASGKLSRICGIIKNEPDSDEDSIF